MPACRPDAASSAHWGVCLLCCDCILFENAAMLPTLFAAMLHTRAPLLTSFIHVSDLKHGTDADGHFPPALARLPGLPPAALCMPTICRAGCGRRTRMLGLSASWQ